MSFQLVSFEQTNEHVIESDNYKVVFDILTATQICKLDNNDQTRAIKEAIKNNEHHIVDIVNFLQEDNAHIILESIDLSLSTVCKHVALESLKNKFSNTCVALYFYRLPKPLTRVELKKSKIHGNGVFTTQVLKDGDIATFYPPHVILYDNNVVGENVHQENYDDYIYCVQRRIAIAGIPQRCDDSTYMGHMINDGSCANNRTAYDKYSAERSNCTFFNIVDVNNICYCVAIIATKKINIGEELILSYGWNYWSDRSNRYVTNV